MKKGLVRIFILCLMICTVFVAIGVTACEENNGDIVPIPTIHSHEFNYTMIEPTCTAGGYTLHECSCGEKYTDNYINALEHDYQIEIIEPTCTEQGYTKHTCTRCKNTYYDNYVEKLAHDYEWTTVKEPTEAERGEKRGVCRVCGDTIVEPVAELNHVHYYNETVIAPTCTTDGYTLHVCNTCGDKYIDNETAALGHTPAAAIEENRIKATCTENGSYDSVVYCTVCHTELTREEKTIPATGHEFVNYVSDGNATYESDGTKTAYCNNGCGQTDTVPDIGSKLVYSGITFKTLAASGTNVNGKVPNSQNTFSFLTEINVSGGATYSVSYDINGNNTIPNKTVNLNIGDNIFYVLEKVNGEASNLFTVTIRRRPIYTVSFNSNGGTSVASQQIEEDSFATAPTTERTGYTFTEWDYDFTKPIIKSTTITASWAYYTLTTNVNNDKAGTVTSHNNTKITVGESVMITATTNAGYAFNGWYNGGMLLTRDLIYQFIMPNDNLFYTAKWTANTDTKYTVETYLENVDGTYTKQNTEDKFGETDSTAIITLNAAPEHYIFNQNDSILSGNINGDTTTVLKVYYARESYDFAAQNENIKGGTVNCTPNGNYKYGNQINLSATINDGYNFVGWFIGDTKISAELEYSFMLIEKTDITAKYVAHNDTPYKVEYYLQNLADNYYTLTDTDNLAGTTDTIATTNVNKEYEHYTFNSSKSVLNANINGDGSTVLQVYYTRDCYSYSVINENTKGGILSCTLNGTYKYEKVIDLLATVNAGYDFVGWFNGDIKISAELDYSFMLTESTKIVARFSAHTDTFYKVEYYLQNLENDNYTLTKTENLTGTTDTQATAGIDTFEHFILNENKSIESGNIDGDGSTILEVYYDLEQFMVSIAAADSAATLSKSYQEKYKYGYPIETIVATANLGYTWIGWYDNDRLLTNSTSIPTFNVKNDINYIAVCSAKDEMMIFDFTSTLDSCTITGVKDNTVTEITLADYVTGIGDNAFSGCLSLTNLFFNGTISQWAQIDGLCRIENKILIYTFSNINIFINTQPLKEIAEIVFEDDITEIKPCAFYGCNNLESVTIPNSVTDIGIYAFLHCTNLSKVNYIGDISDWCKINFANMDANPLYYAHNLYLNGELLNDLIIPNTVTEIKSYAFIQASFENVSISDSVLVIGNSAFFACRDMLNLTFGKGVTRIGDVAFSYCESLTSIIIPSSVTYIGSLAFDNCSALTYAYFENGKDWRRHMEAYSKLSSDFEIIITDGKVDGFNGNMSEHLTCANLKEFYMIFEYYLYKL